MRNKLAKKLRKSAKDFVINRNRQDVPLYKPVGVHPFEIIPEKGLLRTKHAVPRRVNYESARGVYHLFKKLYKSN